MSKRIDIHVGGSDEFLRERKVVADEIADGLLSDLYGGKVDVIYNGRKMAVPEDDDDTNPLTDFLMQYEGESLEIVISSATAARGPEDPVEWTEIPPPIFYPLREPSIVAVTRFITGAIILVTIAMAVCFCFWLGRGAVKFWQ